MITLADAMRMTDVVEKRQALAKLCKQPAPNTRQQRPLFDALGDDSFSVRRDVVRLVVAWQASPGVLAALEQALCDEDNLGRRSAAMEAFGRLGERSLPVLDALLSDTRDGIRRLVVDALGQTQTVRAFPLLRRALDDASPAVRCAAVEALARIDSQQARPILEKLLQTQQAPSVSLAALLAAESAQIAVSDTTLREHLDDSLTAPPALRLLGRAGCPEPVLSRLLLDRGARQRAALLGLAAAFDVRPERVVAAVQAQNKDNIKRVGHDWVGSKDIHVASAALLLLALVGDVHGFASIAARKDNSQLATGCYRAMAAMGDDTSYTQDALRLCPTAAAKEFLQEIFDRSPKTTPSTPGKVKASLSDDDFKHLAQLIETEAGLHFEPHAAYRLEARLLPRLKEMGFQRFDAYVDFLRSNSPDAKRELRDAIAQVTVHETYFFREMPQLNAFIDEVLPALLARKKRLRLWSAGCSSGEEAYTLAILLSEHARKVKPFDFEIVGTDISSRVVKWAEEATYGRRSFRADIDDDLMRRYFVDAGEEVGGSSKKRVVDALRAKVKFRTGNLMTDAPTAFGESFDVIFCRNVLIYFSKPARKQVVENFFARTHPGGVLLLGHSESLFSLETEYELVPLSREMIYAKPDQRGAVLLPTKSDDGRRK